MTMNYKFTTLIILMFICLTMFAKPVYPKNEYLNNGSNTCSTGSVDISVEQRDTDYNYNNSSTHENENVRLTYRHFLGSACTDDFKRVQQENMELKQQLELMKMCGRVNSNPSLEQNKNFNLLVSKCRGVSPTKINNRPNNSGSAWDDLKNDYKEENPDITLMGDKFLKKKNTLKIPKYLTDELPVPTP